MNNSIHRRKYFKFLLKMFRVFTLRVFRNRTMRTVTNYFIVNLAVADFLVILICLPPTVLWDVTETWFMGTLACKVVLYFQVSAFYFIILVKLVLFSVQIFDCFPSLKNIKIILF